MAFPPYLQTDNQAVNYGLTNQLSPEAALKEQALNRRRAIANLLVQQGITPGPGGKMVGRFYVADSPLQGFANLAKAAVGAYLTHGADKEQAQIAKDDQQSVVDAIKAYQEGKHQREALANAPVGVQTQASPPQSLMPEPPPASSAMPPQGEPEPFRGIAPRPDGPYQGQVGAVAMPETGVQSAAPPIPAPVRDPIAGQEMMRGLDFNNSTPADMSQFAQPAQPPTPAQPLPPSPAPAPIPPPAPLMPQPPRRRTLDDLADLLTHQHPQVRAYGKLLADQMMREQERGDQREFMANENELNRQNRMDVVGQQLNQAMMMGLISKDQKDQMLALQAQGQANTAEHQKALQAIQQQVADQTAAHNKATEANQRFQAETQRALLAQGKTPPGYRVTKDGNLEAIPGGPADTKLQGALNQDTAILNSSQAGLDRLASSANQIMNHPGLEGITGIRGKIPDIPGTNAADARALLEKLKSQVAFDVLQDMRNNSKTGGALGNVSDAEGKRLENNLAALNSAQSPEQFKRELQGIIQFTDQAKGRLRDAFNMKHKTGEPSLPAPSGGGSVLNALPQGAKQIGTSGGKPVYQTPDGKKFIGE